MIQSPIDGILFGQIILDIINPPVSVSFLILSADSFDQVRQLWRSISRLKFLINYMQSFCHMLF